MLLRFTDETSCSYTIIKKPEQQQIVQLSSVEDANRFIQNFYTPLFAILKDELSVYCTLKASG